MKHLGDITKIDGSKVPIVDVVTGGSPCQDLSVAGFRKGLSGERSGLFMEQIRIIKEMREHDRSDGRAGEFVRPRYMVWENVPGALSSNGGEDFRIVLEETARVAEPDAVIPGHKIKWTKAGCVMGDRWSIAWRLHDAQFWGVPQRRKRIALVADFGGQSAPEILFERKGVSGDLEQSGAQRERTPGSVGTGIKEPGECNGVERTVVAMDARQQSMVCSYDLANTIAATGYKEPQIVYEMQHASEVIRETRGGVSPTLQSRMGTGGNNIPLVITTMSKKDGKDKTYALQAFGKYKESEVASALKMRDYKDATDIIVNGCQMVRRLTPEECELLQGFPKNWTNIGEWTDTLGKVHKESSDSSRYKALGNSIALPYWKVLARRISAQYDRDITMASLFDGIGGFPLAFEHCGGKAVWASEIEEFPIAVTKRHFPEESEVVAVDSGTEAAT